MEVRFGVDPLTGEGGVAGEVTFVDANTLEVLTPELPGGALAVMVGDPATQQASVLAGGFTAKGSVAEPTDGGGGGCYTRSPGRPAGPRDVLAGTWWLAAVLLWLEARRRRARAHPHAAS